MNDIEDFVRFVNNMNNPVVELHEELHENISLKNWNKRTFSTINLKTLKITAVFWIGGRV